MSWTSRFRKNAKKGKVEMLHENLQVFKVQRPLQSNAPGGMNQLLVYNADRSIFSEMLVGPNAFKDIFPNGGHKTFVTGKILEGEKLYMHEFVPVQDWPEW